MRTGTLAQAQSIFRPRGEHAIGLVGALGHQVIHKHSNVALVSADHQRRSTNGTETCVGSRDDALNTTAAAAAAAAAAAKTTTTTTAITSSSNQQRQQPLIFTSIRWFGRNFAMHRGEKILRASNCSRGHKNCSRGLQITTTRRIRSRHEEDREDQRNNTRESSDVY